MLLPAARLRGEGLSETPRPTPHPAEGVRQKGEQEGSQEGTKSGGKEGNQEEGQAGDTEQWELGWASTLEQWWLEDSGFQPCSHPALDFNQDQPSMGVGSTEHPAGTPGQLGQLPTPRLSSTHGQCSTAALTGYL